MKILIHAVTACMIQLTVDVPGDLGRVIIFPNSGSRLLNHMQEHIFIVPLLV